MGIIIYHNPRCSTSCKALDLLVKEGVEVTIVEYLQKKIGFFELRNVLKFLGMRPDEIIRKKDKIYEDLGLADQDLSDIELIKILAQYPILIERPIVINGEKAIIARPAEKALSILN